MTNKGEPEACAPVPLLVIGWGNALRGDDAAGRRVAESVAGWSRDDVTALSVHQLMPELADALANARRVVFVDATPAAVASAGVRMERVVPSGGGRAGAMGHHGDPAHLLQLTLDLYGSAPEAWLIAIPAHELGLGETLSRPTFAAVEAALGCLRDLLPGESAPTLEGQLRQSNRPAGR